MPTLGNCLQLDRDSMQSLGNWVEIPAGGGPQPSVKMRGQLDMSMHYSGQKTHRSAQIKLALVDHLMMLFRRKQSDFSFNLEGLLCRDAWSWEELCAMQQYALAGNFKLFLVKKLTPQLVTSLEEGHQFRRFCRYPFCGAGCGGDSRQP